MSARTPPRLSNQILDEATGWFIEFAEGGVGHSAREQFIAWLRTSPEHVRAYLNVAAHWEDARSIRNDRSIDELVALARGAGENVIPMTLAGADKEPAPASERKLGSAGRPYRSRVIAAAAMILMLAGGWLVLQARGEIYVTEPGEQRSIRLGDGSVVELNSRSRLRVRFSDRQREVHLLSGQALFRVAKDSKRPFIVDAGDAEVRALGTQFDVYRKATGTVVTVVEGRVNVSVLSKATGMPDGETAAPTLDREDLKRASLQHLSAGEQIVVQAATATPPVAADVAAATAWTRRQMAFQGTALSEVVIEFNRYNTRELIVTDPSIRSVQITGVFSSTDPASLLRALESFGQFTLHETADSVEISGKP